MKLTIKERVLIINTLLPQYDTRENMKVKMSISDKIKLSDQENDAVVVTHLGNNQAEISFKTVEAMTNESDFSLTEVELLYLKLRVDYIDQNGMFSADTIDAYEKILTEAEALTKQEAPIQ